MRCHKSEDKSFFFLVSDSLELERFQLAAAVKVNAS